MVNSFQAESLLTAPTLLTDPGLVTYQSAFQTNAFGGGVPSAGPTGGGGTAEAEAEPGIERSAPLAAPAPAQAVQSGRQVTITLEVGSDRRVIFDKRV